MVGRPALAAAVVLSVATVMSSSAAAYADPPQHLNISFDLTACGQTITATVLVFGEKDHDQKDGSTRTTGVLKVAYTYGDNTVSINASGPGSISADGTVQTGQGTTVGIDSVTGDLLYTAGPFTADISNGPAVITDPAPHIVDLCPLLLAP